MMESTILDGYSKEVAAFYLSSVTLPTTVSVELVVRHENVKFPTKSLTHCPIGMHNDAGFRGPTREKENL